LVTARLKEWLGFRKVEAPRHPTAPEQLPVDELQYIKNETDYIRAAVDSTEGLLKPEDLERVIALTKVLNKSIGGDSRLSRLPTSERTPVRREVLPTIDVRGSNDARRAHESPAVRASLALTWHKLQA
jgi:hypothetical protein